MLSTQQRAARFGNWPLPLLLLLITSCGAPEEPDDAVTTGGSGAGGQPAMAGAGGAPVDVPTVAWGDAWYTINKRCANAVCHVPLYFQPDLSDASNNLFEVLTTRQVIACGSNPLVTPGDPSKSAMMQLIRHECGDLIMPLGCDQDEPVCLFPEEIELLDNWILQGAPH